MKTDDMNEQMKNFLSEERESISPGSKVKNSLDKAFESKHQKSSILPLWINYPVPAWQMAACIALLMVTGIAIGKYKPEEKLTPALMAVADTIYIEKVIPGKTDTIYLEKKSVQYKEQVVVPEESVEPAPVRSNPELMSPDLHISDFHNIQPNGSSIGEDSSAKSWMVRIM